jgi:4a-hydroxytetrahydrobiopterin dehydratase
VGYFQGIRVTVERAIRHRERISACTAHPGRLLIFTPEVIMEDGYSILAKKECVPCKGGVPPLKGAALLTLQAQLGHGWEVVKEHHLEKKFAFPDFAAALDFTNKVGAIAEAEGHHPDIHLAWGKVRVVIWTHKIDGLTESDFVLAAKVEQTFT